VEIDCSFIVVLAGIQLRAIIRNIQYLLAQTIVRGNENEMGRSVVLAGREETINTVSKIIIICVRKKMVCRGTGVKWQSIRKVSSAEY